MAVSSPGNCHRCPLPGRSSPAYARRNGSSPPVSLPDSVLGDSLETPQSDRPPGRPLHVNWGAGDGHGAPRSRFKHDLRRRRCVLDSSWCLSSSHRRQSYWPVPVPDPKLGNRPLSLGGRRMTSRQLAAPPAAPDLKPAGRRYRDLRPHPPRKVPQGQPGPVPRLPVVQADGGPIEQPGRRRPAAGWEPAGRVVDDGGRRCGQWHQGRGASRIALYRGRPNPRGLRELGQLRPRLQQSACAADWHGIVLWAKTWKAMKEQWEKQCAA